MVALFRWLDRQPILSNPAAEEARQVRMCAALDRLEKLERHIRELQTLDDVADTVARADGPVRDDHERP